MAEKKNASPLLETLIAAAITLVIAYASQYMWYLALLLPFPGAYVFARQGAGWGLAIMATAVVIFYFIFVKFFVGVSIVVLIIILCSGLAVRKKLRAYDALLLSAAGWAVAMGALIGYVVLTTGQEPLALIMDFIKGEIVKSDQAALTVYYYMAFQNIAAGTAGIESLLVTDMAAVMESVTSEETISALRYLIGTYVPMLASGIAVLGGIFSYLLPRAIAKKRGFKPAAVPSFDKWKLSKKVSRYFIVMYLLTLIPELFGLTQFELAAVILSSIISMVFTVQGLSLVDYLIRNRIPSRGLRVLILVLVCLFLNSVLPWVGFIEQIFRVREMKFKK